MSPGAKSWGLSILGPHAWRTHRETRMHSFGLEEGPTENAHVQGLDFCASALHVSADGEETSQALTYNSFIED